MEGEEARHKWGSQSKYDSNEKSPKEMAKRKHARFNQEPLVTFSNHSLHSANCNEWLIIATSFCKLRRVVANSDELLLLQRVVERKKICMNSL